MHQKEKTSYIMTKANKTIGDFAVEYLNSENGRLDADFYVWFGDPATCHEIADLSGIRERSKTLSGRHPLSIIQKVLNGLEKDTRFEKTYIRGYRLNRAFILKEEFRNKV